MDFKLDDCICSSDKVVVEHNANIDHLGGWPEYSCRCDVCGLTFNDTASTQGEAGKLWNTHINSLKVRLSDLEEYPKIMEGYMITMEGGAAAVKKILVKKDKPDATYYHILEMYGLGLDSVQQGSIQEEDFFKTKDEVICGFEKYKNKLLQKLTESFENSLLANFMENKQTEEHSCNNELLCKKK